MALEKGFIAAHALPHFVPLETVKAMVSLGVTRFGINADVALVAEKVRFALVKNFRLSGATDTFRGCDEPQKFVEAVVPTAC